MGVQSDWFAGAIERPRIGPLYRVGLAAVAVAMIILPLIYLALVCAAAGATLYLAYGIFALEDISLKGRIFLPAAILAVGGTIVLFLFKPIFAPRPWGGDGTLELNRKEQPRLFAFVAELCDVVGAPHPSRIQVDCDVNASASFRRGLRSIGRKDLVLTIGLPLVASLPLRHVAGVLAHEFGHFAQGAGMGLTYIIRSVNAWFARVIYERDHWDEKLEGWSQGGGDFRVMIVGWIARGGVGIARTILRALMWIGHGISCFALRQMEYDADRSETLVAGSQSFEDCSREMNALGAAGQMARNSVGEAWGAGRLVDDLPGLTDVAFRRLAEDEKYQHFETACAEKTEIFATHPAVGDRVRAAHALSAEGVFLGEGAAHQLFDNFDEICKAATEEEYKSVIGGARKRASRVSVQRFLADSQLEDAAYEALTTVFGEEFHSLLAICPSPDAEAATADLDTIADRLSLLVGASKENLETVAARRATFDQHRDRAADIRGAMGLALLGGRPDRKQFGADPAGLEGLLAAEKGLAEQAQSDLRACYLPMQDRLSIAMSLIARDDLAIEDSPLEAEQVARIHAALGALEQGVPALDELLQAMQRVGGQGDYVQAHAEDETVRNRFWQTVAELRPPIERMREALSSAPLPFSDEVDRTLDSLLPVPPRGKEDGGLIDAAQEAANQFNAVYFRCMAYLSALTIQMERALLR